MTVQYRIPYKPTDNTLPLITRGGLLGPKSVQKGNPLNVTPLRGKKIARLSCYLWVYTVVVAGIVHWSSLTVQYSWIFFFNCSISSLLHTPCFQLWP